MKKQTFGLCNQENSERERKATGGRGRMGGREEQMEQRPSRDTKFNPCSERSTDINEREQRGREIGKGKRD